MSILTKMASGGGSAQVSAVPVQGGRGFPSSAPYLALPGQMTRRAAASGHKCGLPYTHQWRARAAPGRAQLASRALDSLLYQGPGHCQGPTD